MPTKDKNCQLDYNAESKNCLIILQLVSHTANDRYLAFGVRTDSDDDKGYYDGDDEDGDNDDDADDEGDSTTL